MVTKPSDILVHVNAERLRDLYSSSSKPRELWYGDSYLVPQADRISIGSLVTWPDKATAFHTVAPTSVGALYYFAGTQGHWVDGTDGNAIGNRFNYNGSLGTDHTSRESMGLPLAAREFIETETGDSEGGGSRFSLIRYGLPNDMKTDTNAWLYNSRHDPPFVDFVSAVYLGMRHLYYAPHTLTDMVDSANFYFAEASTRNKLLSNITTNVSNFNPQSNARGMYSDGDTVGTPTTPAAGRVNAVAQDIYVSTLVGGELRSRWYATSSLGAIATDKQIAIYAPVCFLVEQISGNQYGWVGGRYTQITAGASFSFWDNLRGQTSAFGPPDVDDVVTSGGGDPVRVTDASQDNLNFKLCRPSDLQYYMDSTTLDPNQHVVVYLHGDDEPNATRENWVTAFNRLLDVVREWPSKGFCSGVTLVWISNVISSAVSHQAAIDDYEKIARAAQTVAQSNKDFVHICLPAYTNWHYFCDNGVTDTEAPGWMQANWPTLDYGGASSYTLNTEYTTAIVDTVGHVAGSHEAHLVSYWVWQIIENAMGGSSRRGRTRRGR